MSTGNSTIAVIKPEIYQKVESIAAACSLDVVGTMGAMQRTFLMAAGLRALREAINKSMLAELMSLQGSPLGFKTDKVYDEDTVKECAIQCLLRGGNWVGNEFNIIASNCYMTKEFFQRKNREFPGLTDLRLNNGVPQLVGDKGALVPYVASWRLNGVPDKIECLLNKLENGIELDERICVRVNSGMGADAILGKAERKMRAKIHARLTGSSAWDGEVDDDGTPIRRPAQNLNDLTARLNGSNGNGNTAPRRSFEEEVKSVFAACETIEELIAAEKQFAAQASSEADEAMVSGLGEQFAAKLSKGKGQKQLV